MIDMILIFRGMNSKNELFFIRAGGQFVYVLKVEDASLVHSFKPVGPAGGEDLGRPNGIAALKNGDILIAMNTKDSLAVFDPWGTYLKSVSFDHPTPKPSGIYVVEKDSSIDVVVCCGMRVRNGENGVLRFKLKVG
jgi:hypothetical protein